MRQCVLDTRGPLGFIDNCMDVDNSRPTIMHPNDVAILQVLDDFLGEYAVGSRVGIPCVFVEGDLARVVVEQRPQNLVWSRR